MSIDSLPTTPTQSLEGCFKGHEGGGVIETFSGLQFNYLAPDRDQIDIHDIAHALALENRFAGHSRYAWSVAAHSVVVYEEIANKRCSGAARMAALLHDAHEAYLKDIPRPLKLIMGGAYREIAARVQAAIHDRFGILAATVTAEEWAMIREVDNQILRVEASVLTHSGGKDWNWGGTKAAPWLAKKISRITPERAETWFLQAARMCGICVEV